MTDFHRRPDTDETDTGGQDRTAPSSHQEIFTTFLMLGLTSFGGPIAHLGYFREAFVVRRRWLSEAVYADLVALCQFLPGPASSQVGFAVGLTRGGLVGALIAWAAFTLPSAFALTLVASFAGVSGGTIGTAVIAGLKIVAVAVVAHALLGMATKLAVGAKRATIAVAAIGLVAAFPGSAGQIAAILAGALAGLLVIEDDDTDRGHSLAVAFPKRAALLCLGLFAALLLGLPLLAASSGAPSLDVIDGIYRGGALVFGGGHVVLPLLEAEIVKPGLLSADSFLTGYAAAQAVPGPLFTFAAYLGMAAGGLTLALAALVTIFVPGFLLVLGVLPFWSTLSASPTARRSLAGTNAAVVGILASALYDPVFTSAIRAGSDLALAALLFVLLAVRRLPPWMVVIVGALGGIVVAS